MSQETEWADNAIVDPQETQLREDSRARPQKTIYADEFLVSRPGRVRLRLIAWARQFQNCELFLHRVDDADTGQVLFSFK